MSIFAKIKLLAIVRSCVKIFPDTMQQVEFPYRMVF